LSQNKGNCSGLAAAIRCIPYHAFNDHTQLIPGGFQDPILFQELKKIFDKLADNAQKFSNGASSNANESLNAMMASKAPKSRCYSRTASADYRFACAIGQKNVGEGYVKKIAQKINLTSSNHLTRHISSRERILSQRRALIKTHAYKKRRMQLKKFRSMLRHRKENQEEDTCEYLIILLDLETSGFEADCDILQIAAQCGKKIFATYIDPVRQISQKASEAHGLTNCSGKLFYYGKQVESVSLRLAL
ncbi:GSCOCG00012126001-RA-CDS, partial [Cotesia congregata]